MAEDGGSSTYDKLGTLYIQYFLFQRYDLWKNYHKALSIGSQKSDIPAYLVTYDFFCHSTVYAGPSIGKKIKTYRHTPCPTTV
jgi:hypothetical protein